MRGQERTVSFYDLHIESRFYRHPDVVPVAIPVSVALQLARAMKGTSPFSKSSPTLKVTVADWQYDLASRQHYVIFNRADASMQDIPLRDLVTDRARMAGKARTEGIDLTCHALIQEPRNPQGRALLLMTNGSSLPVAKLAGMLSRLFKKAEDQPAHAAHFMRPHPSGAAGSMLRLHSAFEVSGHQNATLSHILQGGTLEGVDLISDGDEMLDEESRLKITRTEFQVVPMNQSRLSVTRLIRAIRNFPTDISQARVRYKPPGGSKTESHTFNVDDLDAAFVRRDTIRFTRPIQPRYERVEMAIMEKLIALARTAQS